MGRTNFDQISTRLKESGGGIWIAAKHASFYTGTWTDTRVAAGDYCMRKTATAQAGQAVFFLTSKLLQRIGTDPSSGPTLPGGGQAHDIRGIEVTSIDVVYQITTAALVSHAYDMHETTFVNNTADAVVSTVGGTLTGTLATATQTNPYLTNIVLGTPYVLGRNVADRMVTFEISWDAAATSVLSYYGIYLNCNFNLL